jgi:hypothetical protein
MPPRRWNSGGAWASWLPGAPAAAPVLLVCSPLPRSLAGARAVCWWWWWGLPVAGLLLAGGFRRLLARSLLGASDERDVRCLRRRPRPGGPSQSVCLPLALSLILLR